MGESSLLTQLTFTKNLLSNELVLLNQGHSSRNGTNATSDTLTLELTRVSDVKVNFASVQEMGWAHIIPLNARSVIKESDMEGPSPGSTAMLYLQLPGYHGDSERVALQCVPEKVTAKLNSKGGAQDREAKGSRRRNMDRSLVSSRISSNSSMMRHCGEKGRGSKRLGRSDLQEPACIRLRGLVLFGFFALKAIAKTPKCRVITESHLYFRNLPLAVLWGMVWSGKEREGREMAPEARARGHVMVGVTASGTMGMKKGK